MKVHLFQILKYYYHIFKHYSLKFIIYYSPLVNYITIFFRIKMKPIKTNNNTNSNDNCH